MWPDNETTKDFLNFSGVSDTVAEIIIQAQGRPISIGVSGAWGVGKSSMIKLIRKAFEDLEDGQSRDFVFVEFNAWLYQGYDDARAALLEAIATTLTKEAKKREKGIDKARELLSRVNWLRVAKIAADSATALTFGIPPVGFLAEIHRLANTVLSGQTDGQSVETTKQLAQKIVGESDELLKQKRDSSPPKEIQAIRKCFEKTLKEMGVKLIVLIDDLDRCLPPTTISTLEAIRLFLFLQNTAFVIAADDAMIKHAVRNHFEGIDDDTLVTNYFDKLIQVPIRVPPLGTQEVRAYMMLLFVENSCLAESDKESIRLRTCKQLSKTWCGQRVDRAFIEKIQNNIPSSLISRFDTADRLAPLMTSATQIAGNPRLIKRFLNALSIRMSISKAHGVSVDEAVLAKMLLFERCAPTAAYEALTKAVNEDDEGKPHFLATFEDVAISDSEEITEEPWSDPFVLEWLTVPPRLASIDLRGVLYVSREHAPMIMPEDRLSSEGAEVLGAILEHPEFATELHERLVQLPRHETNIIMDKVLERTRQIQVWGTPPILDVCIAVCTADTSQSSRLVAFLEERPPSQIRPDIVPKIADHPWALRIFDSWSTSKGVAANVKSAINRERK